MGGPRDPAQLLAPQVRGHVEPRIVGRMVETGWQVHRIGSAVYVHRADAHLILGVWARRDPRPAWADRLGRPSAGYQRRRDRAWAEQSWRRMFRDAGGRFLVRRIWTAWPSARVYRWDPDR